MVITKDLGAVSAYAYAVEQGYQGTEEEFAELMARQATVAEEAAASADAAAESASEAQASAEQAEQSAQSISGDVERAEQAATTATGKATEAATSATTANGAAQTATGKAAQAEQSATAAANSASAAATSATNAASSATAAANAQTAAETAQGKAEDAQAAAEAAAQSVSASAAQIAKNTDNFASEFSASTTYAIGDYCIHEGILYRFVNAHTGAWSASDVEATNVGGEIGDVKSAISIIDEANWTLPSSDIIQGSYANSSTAYGKWVANSKRIRNNGFIPVAPGYKIHFTPGANATELLWGRFANGSLVADSQWITTATVITIPNGTDAVILVFRNSSNTDILPSAYDATIVIDTTIANKLDKLGEKITETSDRLDSIYETIIGENLVNPDLLVTGAIQSDGSIATNDIWGSFKTSGFIELEASTDYIFETYSSNYTADSQRKLILLYDDSKQPLTATYQNVTRVQYATFNSSTTAKYARVATVNSNLFKLSKGSTQSSYIPYIEEKNITINLGETPINQVTEMINNNVYVIGKNIIDPSKKVTGVIQSNGTISTSGSWANYSTSDYIELEENTSYTFTVYNTNGSPSENYRKVVLLYDENKLPLQYYNDNTNSKVTFATSTTYKYVRVSNETSIRSQLEKGTTSSSYEDYEILMNQLLGSVPLNQISGDNVLRGKKWCPCGDSFTAYTDSSFDSGKYSGKNKTYPYLIALRSGVNLVETFFQSGRTLAYPSDGTFSNSLTNPSASCYYQNIPSDADYITIYLGINDSHHAPGSSGGDGEYNTGEIPIGTVDDNTTATYGGAWNVVLSWLITNRPKAHIGIIVSNGVDSVDYRNLTIAIARKYGIAYIDLNGDERTPAMIRTVNPDIASAVKTALINKWAVNPSSNTHANTDAHNYESYFIENFLKSI